MTKSLKSNDFKFVLWNGEGLLLSSGGSRDGWHALELEYFAILQP